MSRELNRGPLSHTIPGTMKWYGWGAENEHFDRLDRPYLAAYAARELGVDIDKAVSLPVPLEQIALPSAKINSAFMSSLAEIFQSGRFSTHDVDRLLHASGKSTRDLWRIRKGTIDFAPDCVIFPETEDEIVRLLDAANRANVIIIPFGGGTNVAGCVELHRPDTRMVATVDLRGMAKIIEVDRVSQVVRVQPGILGPALEAELATHGLTLGHFPDSFLYSTVGGWVATRSSGMMSDRYGNIEDMVLALRMVAPGGVLKTIRSPRSSNGPDTKHVCIGSEGALGIITELTLRVHASPQHREFRGYLFPDWKSGIAALRECQQSNCKADLARLNDPSKTELSVAFRRRSGVMATAMSRLFKSYLKSIRKFSMPSSCLLIAAFDGTRSDICQRRHGVETIYKKHGAVALGRGPGNSFARDKFDFPHVRDFLFDYDIIADVAETSTTWAGLDALYTDVKTALANALGGDGHRFWVGCHISHTYHAGAALYFTFAFRANAAAGADQQAEFRHYLGAKRAALEAFQAHGSTLSHHHAVGYEHLPWLRREAVLVGGTLVDSLKPKFDPDGIMNPGKLATGYSIAEWESRCGASANADTTPPAEARSA